MNSQFYWWRKPEHTEKTTDLTQVPGNLYQKSTDLTQVTSNIYHIMQYRVHITWVEFELTRLLVIGTDWIGSHISNYHTKIAWKWWLWWNKINWSTALSYHPIIFLLETYKQVRSTKVKKEGHPWINWLIDFWCLTPLSAIFQLYHGDQF